MEDSGPGELHDELQNHPLKTNEKNSNVFEIETELNMPEVPNYEDERIKHKLGYFKSAMLFIQAAASLSLFTLQQPLSKVGLVGGFFVTLVVGYITCYGLVQMSALATEIEKDYGMKGRVKNLYKLTEHIQGKHLPFVRWLMMIAGLGMMYSSSISNIILVSDTLEHHIGLQQWVSKTIIFLVISLGFLIIVEPEKIKYVNLYMTALLFGIAYIIFGRNIYSWAHGEGEPWSKITLFNWKYIGVWGGNLAYAFEVASGFLSLRLTASSDVNYESVTSWMTLLVGFNYFFLSGAHMLGNKASEITENSFQMMSKHGDIWKVLIYLYMINTSYTFSFNTIFTSEIIETMPPIEKVIVDNKGNIARHKLIILRIALWAVAVGISFFATNIIMVLNISGSIFSPIVSYFGPLILTYAYRTQKGDEVPKSKRIHDLIYVSVAFTISIWGIVNAFHND